MEGKQKPNPTLEDNELLTFINFAMEYLEAENFLLDMDGISFYLNDKKKPQNQNNTYNS